jgi:hypothetical protein
MFGALCKGMSKSEQSQHTVDPEPKLRKPFAPNLLIGRAPDSQSVFRRRPDDAVRMRAARAFEISDLLPVPTSP